MSAFANTGVFMSTSFLILAGIMGLTLAGDYCIKLASDRSDGLTTATFLMGAFLYGIPAVGWFFLMRSHSLAVAGVLYAASTVIMLGALGYFVFREALGLREIAGMLLAISAVVVVSWET